MVLPSSSYPTEELMKLLPILSRRFNDTTKSLKEMDENDKENTIWAVKPNDLCLNNNNSKLNKVKYSSNKRFYALPFNSIMFTNEEENYEDLFENIKKKQTSKIYVDDFKPLKKKGANNDWWPGDWKCNRCGNHNFSYRERCKRCKFTRYAIPASNYGYQLSIMSPSMYP